MIEIFGKTMCPYCDDFSRDVFFDMFPTARTFPQIKVDGVSIGGYNELDAWHLSK
jgi:glutaredoxin